MFDTHVIISNYYYICITYIKVLYMQYLLLSCFVCVTCIDCVIMSSSGLDFTVDRTGSTDAKRY